MKFSHSRKRRDELQMFNSMSCTGKIVNKRTGKVADSARSARWGYRKLVERQHRS